MALVFHELGHVGGFSPQAGTGVQNPFTGFGIEDEADQLGGFVLDLEEAVCVAGQLVHGSRGGELDAVGAVAAGFRGVAGLDELLGEGVHIGF